MPHRSAANTSVETTRFADGVRFTLPALPQRAARRLVGLALGLFGAFFALIGGAQLLLLSTASPDDLGSRVLFAFGGFGFLGGGLAASGIGVLIGLSGRCYVEVHGNILELGQRVGPFWFRQRRSLDKVVDLSIPPGEPTAFVMRFRSGRRLGIAHGYPPDIVERLGRELADRVAAITGRAELREMFEVREPPRNGSA